MTARITGLVNTLNAADTLDLCLASMRDHVDELLVVDMHSSDETVAIAESFGARVLMHEPVGYVEPARTFGIDAAAHEWIVILDADEVMPPLLGQRLRDIAQRDEADVVVIGRRNHLFGAVAEHGPFGPQVDRHRRFFRRTSLMHSPRIHVPPEPVPGARELALPPTQDLCLTHFAYVDLSDWAQRSDRYTTIEARSALESSAHAPKTSRVLMSALKAFLDGYVRQRGFRDGWRGLHTALALASYRLTVGLKAQQLARVGDAAEVRRRYREDAARVIGS